MKLGRKSKPQIPIYHHVSEWQGFHYLINLAFHLCKGQATPFMLQNITPGYAFTLT